MAETQTGDDGRTERLFGDKPESVRILIGEGSWQIFSPEAAIIFDRWDDDTEKDDSEDE